jgi:hypothetical protein
VFLEKKSCLRKGRSLRPFASSAFSAVRLRAEPAL